ncbi:MULTISPECIES: hypothetical protein [unclassified Fibrobacter]|uniref:hypothetical protein n=1 Tax=unclassified Fibrobacter TaxID=2634177 RepID=UPI000917E9BE|nr:MULTISPECIES: hypothetical protein [Fibrobacter]MCL4102504.1 hypothetical protein [Fibrobacter succinogenes]SHL40312.1 hypothetical protein SAMN05720764_11348 [Fibrobacter sp. UWH5]SHL53146.1 hypothetical protein SAMN05720765_11671 [Fibrobacter sp. UWH6]
MAPHRDLLLSESKTKILRRQLKRRMLEFIRQADAYGIDIVISFDIENANADQLERTMNDLEMIDATVENEPC